MLDFTTLILTDFLTPTEVVYGAMIPEPDYSDDERETQPSSVSSMVARNNKVNTYVICDVIICIIIVCLYFTIQLFVQCCMMYKSIHLSYMAIRVLLAFLVRIHTFTLLKAVRSYVSKRSNTRDTREKRKERS